MLVGELATEFLFKILLIDHLFHRLLEVISTIDADFRCCEFIDELLYDLPETANEPGDLHAEELEHASSVVLRHC